MRPAIWVSATCFIRRSIGTYPVLDGDRDKPVVVRVYKVCHVLGSVTDPVAASVDVDEDGQP